MSPRVFRFAPSPNGLLHLGHALSALLNADMASACGGRLLVRIEDIDGTRARPRFVEAIETDLAWLGIAYERPVRRQSEHVADYRAALDRLTDMGLAYVSVLSRGEIADEIARREAASGLPWPRDPDGAPLYPGGERARATTEGEDPADGRPFAIRLDMARAIDRVGSLAWCEHGDRLDGAGEIVRADPAAWGDIVLAGKFTPASYHLAVVVDDAIQGVSDVVRGRDLFQATAVHRLLQALLGLPEPAYHHHRLMLDDDGRKLSKSRGSLSLAHLRDTGVDAASIRQRLGLPPRPIEAGTSSARDMKS